MSNQSQASTSSSNQTFDDQTTIENQVAEIVNFHNQNRTWPSTSLNHENRRLGVLLNSLIENEIQQIINYREQN